MKINTTILNEVEVLAKPNGDALQYVNKSAAEKKATKVQIELPGAYVYKAPESGGFYIAISGGIGKHFLLVDLADDSDVGVYETLAETQGIAKTLARYLICEGDWDAETEEFTNGRVVEKREEPESLEQQRREISQFYADHGCETGARLWAENNNGEEQPRDDNGPPRPEEIAEWSPAELASHLTADSWPTATKPPFPGQEDPEEMSRLAELVDMPTPLGFDNDGPLNPVPESMIKVPPGWSADFESQALQFINRFDGAPAAYVAFQVARAERFTSTHRRVMSPGQYDVLRASMERSVAIGGISPKGLMRRARRAVALLPRIEHPSVGGAA